MPPKRIEFSPSYAHVRACTRMYARARYTPDAATQRLTLRAAFIEQQSDSRLASLLEMKPPAYQAKPPCTPSPLTAPNVLFGLVE